VVLEKCLKIGEQPHRFCVNSNKKLYLTLLIFIIQSLFIALAHHIWVRPS